MNVKQYQLTLFFGRYKTRSAGVWVYSVELLNTLCELTQERKEIKDLIFPMRVVFSGLDEQLEELEKIKMKYAELLIDIVRLENFKNHRKLGMVSDFFKRFNDTKILHGTANVLPLFGRSKKILTLHDLFQAYPVIELKGIYARLRVLVYRCLFFLQCKRADMIVSDLSLVKESIEARYEINNVYTVLPGLKSVYLNSPLPLVENKGQYLVAFAALDPRKNITKVIQAFLNERFLEDVSLKIVACSDTVKNKLDDFLETNNISNIEVLTQVSDSEMQELYMNARGVVFPSLAEGFGFPIYEALSQGVAVVASSNLTIEQIRVEVRPFVIECDPYSCESIGNAMQRVVSLIQRAEKRQTVASFVRKVLNFKNTAIHFVDLYKALL
ncbi:MAG: glycosyltransferase [Bdellovibrionota bacterium]